jgi:hypothetical protein
VVDPAATLGEEFLDVAVGGRSVGTRGTASTIASEGKRKPAKAERGGIDRRER